MVILHVGFCGDRLFLWGEASAAGRDGDRGLLAVSRLPTAASVTALAEAATAAACHLDPEREESFVAWLPTRAGVPVPSNPLVTAEPGGTGVAHEGPADDEAAEMAPWCIPALPLSDEVAIDLLGACAGQELVAPGVLLGSDVRFWARVLRFAGALTAREQFLPGLAERDGVFRARWTPVVLGSDAERLALLAGAMPHAARALTRAAGSPPRRCADGHPHAGPVRVHRSSGADGAARDAAAVGEDTRGGLVRQCPHAVAPCTPRGRRHDGRRRGGARELRRTGPGVAPPGLALGREPVPSHLPARRAHGAGGRGVCAPD